MERAAVESSALASVGYDSDAKTLEVEFRTRKLYRYYEVPKRIYEQLMDAPSKGQFFNTRIRNAFRYVRV
jgi:KTSC domain